VVVNSAQTRSRSLKVNVLKNPGLPDVQRRGNNDRCRRFRSVEAPAHQSTGSSELPPSAKADCLGNALKISIRRRSAGAPPIGLNC
jgi:hypothetical protein